MFSYLHLNYSMQNDKKGIKEKYHEINRDHPPLKKTLISHSEILRSGNHDKHPTPTQSKHPIRKRTTCSFFLLEMGGKLS